MDNSISFIRAIIGRYNPCHEEWIIHTGISGNYVSSKANESIKKAEEDYMKEKWNYLKLNFSPEEIKECIGKANKKEKQK